MNMPARSVSDDDPTGKEVMNLVEFIKSMEINHVPDSKPSSAESTKASTPAKMKPKMQKRASAFELIGKKISGSSSKEKGLEREHDFNSLDDVAKDREETTKLDDNPKEKLQKVARAAAYVKNIRKMDSVPANLGQTVLNK